MIAQRRGVFEQRRIEPLEPRLALATTADEVPALVITVAATTTQIEATRRVGPEQVVKRGPGAVVLTVANAHTGGTLVEEGQVIIRDPAALGAGPLIVKPGAIVRLDVGTRTVLVPGLTLDPLARLDLGRGLMLIPPGAVDPAAVRSWIVAARNGGGWDGAAGIGSSSTTASGGLAVGMTTTPQGTTIGWAAAGDTNIDGFVDVLDMANVLTGNRFNSGTAAVWADGDFNYDATVDVADIAAMVTSDHFGRGTYRLPPPVVAPPGPTFDYGDVLQKSLLFYDAQRSGDLPDDFRVAWRGDSALGDGSDVGVDLTGGYYDAGDHVKFGLPMAATMTMLAWGVVQYRDAYAASGLLEEMLEALKWGTDWLVKAHPEPNVFYAQVGNGGADHAFWGPAEVMTMSRPAYRVDATKPGSDVAGEAAAALAAGSIAFRATDAAYADLLLGHARQLYSFADTYRGRYSDAIPDAASFYNSFSGYVDELCWGALWLHTATGEAAWLTKAMSVYDAGLAGQKLQWTQAWDDKVYGSAVLLAAKTGLQRYKADAERWLDWWTVGTADGRVRTTAGGLAFLDTWGSLRYASNTAFIALVYADTVQDHANRYHDFAVRQIRYVLGDNPAGRSYVVGFGVNPPKNPHHRGASGVYDGNIAAPFDNRHVLFGALVGGPQSASDTDYVDSRSNYICNEVALDYNAGFQGAVARLYLEYGGGERSPAPPPAEVPGDEFFVQTAVNTTGSGFTEIRALLHNRSAWPARWASDLSFVYFVDLSEVYAAGYSAADVQVTSNYVQGGRVGSLQPWDESQRIYAVTVDFTGTRIGPGTGTSFWREAQFRVGLKQGIPSSAWSSLNDWSYQGISADRANPTLSPYTPVYGGTTRLFGRVPDGVVAPPPDPGTGTNPPPTPPPTPPPAPPATSGAAAAFSVSNSWAGGFTADMRITNGSTVLTEWTLEFDLDAEIVNVWNGVLVSHTGRRYVIRNAAWNGTLAAGGQVTFGFQANGTGSSLPSNLAWNGTALATPA
jgi:autotransporter-associated beta strand protein